MTTCTEFAVFEVKQADLARVLAVSESLFLEINAKSKNIIAHEILVKMDNPSEDTQEICWHLTWVNIEAVKASSSQWSSYPSASIIEGLVGKKRYYGHFVALVGH